MADIFISYSRKDWNFAKALATELQRLGYDLWWDEHLVAGQEFRPALQEQLRAAKVVIVIWSIHSANSPFVLEEVNEALHFKKLIATRLPDMNPMDIPLGFREQQTVMVTNREKIQEALEARGVRPAGGVRDESSAEYADEVAKLLKQKGGSQILAPVLPLVVLMGGMILGMSVIVISVLLGVGWVRWDPGEVEGVKWLGPKQVGYVAAVNWSVTTVVIVPLAWALILIARQVLIAARDQMVIRNMVVSQDFEPITVDDHRIIRMRKDIEKVINRCILAVTSLIVLFSLVDFYTVVDRVYRDPVAARKMNIVSASKGYALEDVNMERDWSLAAHLERADGGASESLPNWLFAAVVYVGYAGFGIGFLFSFFIALFGVGMFFMPEVAQKYGLVVIPNLESRDRRFGFEVLAPFFSVTLSIAMLCMIMTYTMSLQNIYLRVPDRNLVEFLLPRPDDAARLWGEGKPGQAVNALIGHVGYVPGNSPQTLLAWFVAAFMVIATLGVAYLFLRASALQGRAKVTSEYERFGPNRLRRITQNPLEEVMKSLAGMHTWPVTWPGLNATMAGASLIITSFIFYKLGVVLMVLGLGFVIHNTFQLFRPHAEN